LYTKNNIKKNPKNKVISRKVKVIWLFNSNNNYVQKFCTQLYFDFTHCYWYTPLYHAIISCIGIANSVDQCVR
jgi:hypothetical protein